MNMKVVLEDQPVQQLETAEAFVEAMARAVTPVSIVTTDGKAGRFGVTVSAVNSVSAAPPMVLACINKRSPAIAAIRENGVFSINMLSVGQDQLADCFAGRARDGESYDFACGEFYGLSTGAPVLNNATANFDCVLDCVHDAATHAIVIGKVVRAVSTGAGPLAYNERAYQGLMPLAADSNFSGETDQ